MYLFWCPIPNIMSEHFPALEKLLVGLVFNLNPERLSPPL